MPIVDYKAKAEADKQWFLNQPISEINKSYVKEYIQYLKLKEVTYARIGLVYRHLEPLLSKISDVKDLFDDKKTVRKIYTELQEEKGKAHYQTIINVSLAFVRWLNDGEKPKGFSEIKNPSKKKKRELTPNDMIIWEEGLKMANETTSVQLKAIITTQLDAGFRPSEFIDLTYGDVSRDGEFLILNVKHGKTGGRKVICHRCVPYLARWLNQHPTKKEKDPLWVIEMQGKSHRKDGTKTQGYRYEALRKRVRELGERAGIKKPLDFYNFRHSSCYLDKLDNVPLDLASERHGHSVDFFIQTYGRLSVKDKTDRLRSHYNLEGSDKHEPLKNVVCRCGAINDPEDKYCESCGAGLTVETALETKKMLEEMNDFKKFISEINPETMNLVRELALKIQNKSDVKNAMR